MILKKLIQDLPVKNIHALRPSDLECEVQGLTQDSRLVKKDFVFVAIAGVEQDGNSFIDQAIKAGACAVVVSQPVKSSVTTIEVENSRQSLAELACRFYNHPSRFMRVVGVTGTNGKTTTSYIIESLLKADGRKVGVIGTVNYRYADRVIPASNTTPESVDIQKIMSDMYQAGVTDVVMEVSSHALTMDRVFGVDFDVAAFTNLTQDHLDYHLSLEKYFEAKASLFSVFLPQGKKKKYAVLNHYSNWSQKIDIPQNVQKISVGDNSSDIACVKSSFNAEGMKLTLSLKGEEVEIETRLLGRFNLENILVSVGVAHALGVSSEKIQKGIASIPQIPGRLERIENQKQIHVFVDFAHTPDALARVGEQLKSLATHHLVTVFGCGGDRDKTKRPLMAREAEKFSDVVIVTSDNPRTEDPKSIIQDIMKGFQYDKISKDSVLQCVDRKEALTQAIQLAKPGDMILVAGKGHEDYQIIGKTKTHFSDQEVLRTLLKDAA